MQRLFSYYGGIPLEKAPMAHGSRLMISSVSFKRVFSKQPDIASLGRLVVYINVVNGCFDEEEVLTAEIGSTLRCKPGYEDWCACAL